MQGGRGQIRLIHPGGDLVRLADVMDAMSCNNVRGGPCDLRFAIANVAHRQHPEDPWPLTGLFPPLLF